jgi:methyl-CpG-binding domain protein 4
MSNKSWVPPKSPIGMLQEETWPDIWKTLLVCILHNQTQRKQVDKIYKELFEMYPTPRDLMKADIDGLTIFLMPLGFQNKRSKTIIKFSEEFVTLNWDKPSDLFGCGQYADQCFSVFYDGKWKGLEITDSKLKAYVEWMEKMNIKQFADFDDYK